MKPKRILIVEDEVVTRLSIKAIVESRVKNCVVILSPNGEHALELLKTNKDIDLVITDMSMPKMDGRELIKLMHSNTKLAKKPVIIMSAVVSIREISDLLETGASFFLAKPIKNDELIGYIEKSLGG